MKKKKKMLLQNSLKMKKMKKKMLLQNNWPTAIFASFLGYLKVFNVSDAHCDGFAKFLAF
jgi:hypothetical protein